MREYLRFGAAAAFGSPGYRLTIVIVLHALSFATSLVAATLLRFDFHPPAHWSTDLAAVLPVVLGIKLAVFGAAGQYSRVWRHVTFADLGPLTWTNLAASVAVACWNLTGWSPNVSRGVLLIDCGTSLLLVGALRSGYRLTHDLIPSWFRRSTLHRALLVGANRAEKVLALNLHLHPDLPYRIRGFIDPTKPSRNEVIGGVPVVGSVDDLIVAARERNITDVVVIAGGVPGDQLRKVRAACEAERIKVRILPPLASLLNGDRRLPLREVELKTLLRREPVTLDREAMRKLIDGRSVMVTGAGGSIGSELCRQLLEFAPQTLALVEQSEGHLYEIDMELRGRAAETTIVPCLADVVDTARMRRLMRRHRPEIVFHVAAHKHVPLLEDQPGEAVKNNVFGTARMAELAHECGVDRFVFISTDKAVHPSSVMGTTKHLAERYVHALSAESETRFMCVRFGNVLGSAGSVVPLFQKQIRQGGPITVTHPEMNRFFMTIEEASQLVVQAATIGSGGEIFVLDMGEPIRIVDLARDLVQGCGLPAQAVDIVFSGVRPGEKLSEQLYFDDERRLPTKHPKVMSTDHRPFAYEQARRMLRELEELVDGDEDALLDKLQELVPEYAAQRRRSPAPRRPAHAPPALTDGNLITTTTLGSRSV